MSILVKLGDGVRSRIIAGRYEARPAASSTGLLLRTLGLGMGKKKAPGRDVTPETNATDLYCLVGGSGSGSSSPEREKFMRFESV